MWKNRRVLVTGATGLLGSHLTQELVLNEADVTTIIRDYVPNSMLNGWLVMKACGFARGDIEDFNFVNRVINEYQIQTVFHLAAQTQVRVANTNPLPTFRSNIMGTWNVLEACRLNNVEQVLVASSDKAYGAADVLPYNENTPLRGDHPYDVSKSCADMLAQTYTITYGMNVGITRCGNLFGEGDLNFDRLIPGTIQAYLNDKAPVIRSDGTMIRDYFYVKDAVQAYLTLAERMLGYDGSLSIFNFSYGEPMSVLDMVEYIGYLMETDIKPVVENTASNEIQEQFLDSSKAREVLGWKPLWGLESAMKETIEWYRENK